MADPFPLAMLLVAFGAQTVAGLGPAWAGLGDGVPYTTAVVLLFPYSLGRWASGRHVSIGVALLMVVHFGREHVYGNAVGDNLIGAGFLLLPVVLGVAVRLAVGYRSVCNTSRGSAPGLASIRGSAGF